MGRPTDAPTWATDANYAAGGSPWSSTPTKSKPSAGRIASGVVPAQGAPAEEFNWLLNNHGQFLSVLDNAILTTGLTFYDDFNISTVGTSWTSTGVTVVTDTGLAWGCVNIATNSTSNHLTMREPVQATSGDFILIAKMRVLTKSTESFLLDIAGFAWSYSNASSNWNYGSTTSGFVDTGISVATAYKVFFIQRVGTTVQFYIDGILIATVTDSTSLNGNELEMTLGATGSGSSIRIDFIRLWCAR